MNKEKILETIRTSKFTEDKNNKFGPSFSSQILFVFNNTEAYGIWIVKYTNEEIICVSKTFPNINSGLTIDDVHNIDDMNVMWGKDIISKFGTLENAMLNYNI